MKQKELYVVDELGNIIDKIEAEDKYVKLSEGDKVMFVIVNKESKALGKYYMSKYIVQGEYYLAFTDDIEKAKRYSSFNRANLGLEKLIDKVGFRYELSVEEVKYDRYKGRKEESSI